MAKAKKVKIIDVLACAIDTETTGFNPPVVPIEFVYSPTKDELSDFDPSRGTYTRFRFDPERSIEYGAMATHGVRPRDLKGQPKWNDYVFNFRPQYFIGHNVDYDVDNIRSSLDSAFTAKNICTLALSRLAFPDVDSHKLGALAYFMLEEGLLPECYSEKVWEEHIEGAHGAGADVHMTSGLMCLIRDHLKLETWEEAFQASEVARIPTKMAFGKHVGEDIRKMEYGPKSWRAWCLRQPGMDPYLLRAMAMTPEQWRQHMLLVDGIRKRAG